MAIDAIVGIVSAVGDLLAAPAAAAAADVGAGVAAADVGAGVAAADVGAAAGATALPEILVTPAAAGAEAAGAGALTGGALTGAEAAGAGLTAGAPLAGAAGAAATGALGATEALGGAAAPTAALSPADVVGQDFGTLSAAGIGPSTDISGALTGAGNALTAADVMGTGIGDTALSFAGTTAPIDPLSGVGGGGGGLATDAFANAPAGTVGTAPADFATALNTGQLSGAAASGGGAGAETITDPTSQQLVNELTAGTGVSPPVAASTPPTPSIPSASAGTSPSISVGGETISPATVTDVSNLAPSGLSAAASNLFSGSTLRTLGALAPLGALGYTLFRGQPSLPSYMQQAVNNLGPAQAVASTNLNEAASGILQPGQAAQINQYTTNAKNQLYQLYARQGRDPTGDTDYIQGLASIDQQAQIMSQQFITAAVTNGLNAQGVVDSTLQAAANMQIAQDNAFQSSLNSALQSFGLVTALNAAGSRSGTAQA